MTGFGCQAPLGPGGHLAGAEEVSGRWEGVGPAAGERPARPSSRGAVGGELLESLARGQGPGAVASSDACRLSPDGCGPQCVGGVRWVATAARPQRGSPRAAPQAWRSVWRRRPAAAGLWVVCPAWNGSPARSWSAGPRPSVLRGRGPAGRRGRRRAPERGPAAAAGTWSAIPGTKASTTREGTAARGRARPRDRGEGEGGRGAARRRPRPSARRRRAQRTLPRAPAPRPEGLPA